MKTVLRILLGLVLVAAFAGLAFYLHPLWVSDQMIRLRLWQHGVRGGYVEVEGNQLHYFEAGKQDGTPLVLIHGLEARGEDWAALIPAFAARGFHVYVPDLPGYGRSAKPDIAYSISQEEHAVAGFMDAMHISHADVGGWSMGGWIALKLALDEPARVNRVIAYDSAGVYFTPTFTAADFAPSDPAGVLRLSRMLTPHAAKLPDFVAQSAIKKLQRDSWVVSRSIRSMEAGKDLLDFHLGAIRQPVLIVWGKQDRLIPLAVGLKMHAGITGSNLLVVDGCGHLAPAECTAPVLRGSIDFLRANPAPTGVEREVAGKP